MVQRFLCVVYVVYIIYLLSMSSHHHVRCCLIVATLLFFIDGILLWNFTYCAHVFVHIECISTLYTENILETLTYHGIGFDVESSCMYLCIIYITIMMERTTFTNKNQNEITMRSEKKTFSVTIETKWYLLWWK